MARSNLGLVLPACCCVAAASGPGGCWLGMADDGNNTLASLVVAPPQELPGASWPWQQAIRAAAGLPVASLARLARHVLLEPWGHPVTAAQLLLCLKAAERCIAGLQAQLQAAAADGDAAGAATQREGTAGCSTSSSEAVTPVVGLLAQLRGHCEHQPSGDVPAALHGAEAALATAGAALQLAAELAQRWQQAANLLGRASGAAALLQELLFSAVSLLHWGGTGTEADIAAGEDAAGAAAAGSAAAVAAARLVAAVSAMPGTQCQALSAALDCDLRSELSLVLASAVEAALSCNAVGASLQCALDAEAIQACAQAAASLPAVPAGDHPQERARALVDCAGNLARLAVLLLQHCGKDAAAALDSGVVAVCREALAFMPVAALDFAAAGDCLLAVREAVNANPGLGLALASGGYLEELVGWAEGVARNLKRGTADAMLLALQPARLLVSTVAAAVLGCTRVDRFGLEYQAWFKALKRFRSLPEPKLRGTYTWEQLARREVLPQLLAWASTGAAAEGAPGA